MDKILLRPPHFPFKVNYSIKKLVGYAENIANACKQILVVEKEVTLPGMMRIFRTYANERNDLFEK